MQVPMRLLYVEGSTPVIAYHIQADETCVIANATAYELAAKSGQPSKAHETTYGNTNIHNLTSRINAWLFNGQNMFVCQSNTIRILYYTYRP